MNLLLYKKLVFLLLLTNLLFVSNCIDTVKKNPISIGSRIVCRIDANYCNGCGLCIKACPYNAIIETQLNDEWVCFIDPDKCNGCGECITACEDDAIRKIEFLDSE